MLTIPPSLGYGKEGKGNGSFQVQSGFNVVIMQKGFPCTILDSCRRQDVIYLAQIQSNSVKLKMYFHLFQFDISSVRATKSLCSPPNCLITTSPYRNN